MSQSPLCKMEVKKDENGKEILLKEGKFQVMMEWEKPYMYACIDALKPFGDVLEIGFGLGYSATRIQSYHPKSHTIIEYHPEVATYARQFAKKHPDVTIVEATWQSALKTLGVFDCIFFDDYPLYDEKQMIQMEKDSRESIALLNQGQKLLEDVHAQIPGLLEIHYSDEDLNHLVQQINLHTKADAIQWIRFLKTLEEQNQITVEQFSSQLKTLLGQDLMTKEEVDHLFATKKDKKSRYGSETNDRLFCFLSECLTHHMRKGSKFSCFLSDPTSKFEDSKFFNEIITNPHLEYHEELLSIEVPKNCDYYHHNQALVITITKMSDSDLNFAL